MRRRLLAATRRVVTTGRRAGGGGVRGATAAYRVSGGDRGCREARAAPRTPLALRSTCCASTRFAPRCRAASRSPVAVRSPPDSAPPVLQTYRCVGLAHRHAHRIYNKNIRQKSEKKKEHNQSSSQYTHDTTTTYLMYANAYAPYKLRRVRNTLCKFSSNNRQCKRIFSACFAFRSIDQPACDERSTVSESDTAARP